MKRRYSIWGMQYGASHESELAQCDSNPQPVLDGFAKMTVTVKPSIFDAKQKRTKIRKYTWLRIVENHHGEKNPADQ